MNLVRFPNSSESRPVLWHRGTRLNISYKMGFGRLLKKESVANAALVLSIYFLFEVLCEYVLSSDDPVASAIQPPVSPTKRGLSLSCSCAQLCRDNLYIGWLFSHRRGQVSLLGPSPSLDLGGHPAV